MSWEKGTENPRDDWGLENREQGCSRACNHLYCIKYDTIVWYVKIKHSEKLFWKHIAIIVDGWPYSVLVSNQLCPFDCPIFLSSHFLSWTSTLSSHPPIFYFFSCLNYPSASSKSQTTPSSSNTSQYVCWTLIRQKPLCHLQNCFLIFVGYTFNLSVGLPYIMAVM